MFYYKIKMEKSKPEENQEYLENSQQKNYDNSVLEISEIEVQNIIISEEPTEPCCSWQIEQKLIRENITVTKEILKDVEEVVTTQPKVSCWDVQECQNVNLNGKSSIIHPPYKDLLSENSSLNSNSVEINHHDISPEFIPSSESPAYFPNTVNVPQIADVGIFRVNIPNCTIFPPLPRRQSMMGPPPSYSKSLLDRRINPCASIQFVAPIPPPSYDGTDHELRYAGLPGFTLGLGNTWQSQSQPAYCSACEMVTITRTEIRVSGLAHAIALTMFFFLCWPFCLLPYFLNFCNYTFHYCSVCQNFLGSRTPFQRN